MLGLSCTFLACVFDRLDWALNHVMGLWWAYVGSLGGSAGPMFGLCSAYVEQKRCRDSGLCSANFNPDLRKIRSGLRKTVLFGPCPSHIGPILCQVVGMLGLSCSNWHIHWATRRNFTLYKFKIDMTFFWLKMKLSSYMQMHQWNILFGWNKPTGDGNKRTMYVCLYIDIDR